jgi:predicted Zn-dependent protease
MLLLVLVGHLVVAQTGDADRLIKTGTVLYDAGKYVEAAEVLLKAYALQPDPSLLYNIGRSYERAGDAKKAARFYTRCMAKKARRRAFRKRRRRHSQSSRKPTPRPPSRRRRRFRRRCPLPFQRPSRRPRPLRPRWCRA